MRLTRPTTIRRGLAVGVTVLALTAASGVAVAVIDGGAVYTACKLNKTGTLRLIDPSLPSTNPLSKCTIVETQISWNERGPTGATGPQGDEGPTGAEGAVGPPGANGADGQSVTTEPLDFGSAQCPVGGFRFSVRESVAYVCNGERGEVGPAGEAGTSGLPTFDFIRGSTAGTSCFAGVNTRELAYAGDVRVTGHVTFQRTDDGSVPIDYRLIVGRGGRVGDGPVLASGTWTGQELVVPIDSSWTIPGDLRDTLIVQVSGNVSPGVVTGCNPNLVGAYSRLHTRL